MRLSADKNSPYYEPVHVYYAEVFFDGHKMGPPEHLVWEADEEAGTVTLYVTPIVLEGDEPKMQTLHGEVRIVLDPKYMTYVGGEIVT